MVEKENREREREIKTLTSLTNCPISRVYVYKCGFVFRECDTNGLLLLLSHYFLKNDV